MKTTKYYKAIIDFGGGCIVERNLRLQADTYIRGGGLAIVAFERNGEPWSDITVNLPGYFPEYGTAFIDTNNNPWAEAFLVEHDIAEPTAYFGHSGFCSYPLYKFDMKKFKTKYPNDMSR